MKKIILCVLCCACFGTLTFGQSQRVVYANRNQIESFFNSKTMVVMDADAFSDFNMSAPEAMKKYWTITPYEIITSDQFDQMRTDPTLSFIFMAKVQLQRDRRQVHYQYINVVMGAPRVRNLGDMPELLSLPLAYSGSEEEDYADKLPLMLRFAQVHINNLRAARNPSLLNNLKNIGTETQREKDEILTHLIKEKTLLVKESDLSEQVNTIEKIQNEYPGKVKIVSPEELQKAIEEQTPNTAVLHQVSPGENDNSGRSYCVIIGADNARLYYYNDVAITQRRPPGMLARDFRLIQGRLF